jgi:predicted transcriptional regulator
MDVFDKFFKKYSYKFPKGYPDMKNEQDVLLLENILYNLLEERITLYEASEVDAKKAIEILKNKLNLTDSDFTKESSVRYKILVPRSERYNYVEKITKLPGFKYNPNAKGSSIGAIEYNGISFLLKPSNLQGRASAGTENEDVIVNEINNYIYEGAKNIVFKSPNKTLKINNVKEAVAVGYDVSGGKKADIIINADKNYPISIKKDNASFWESADTRYKDIVTTLSKKIKAGDFSPELTFMPFTDKLGNKKEGINTMYNKKTKSKISGVIVTDLPPTSADSIIFGSDKATVIYRSFTPNDFELDGDTLYITVSKIISNLKDVYKYNLEPVLNIRHDSTRQATGGLRATVQPKDKVYSDEGITGNKIELSYNDIMS